jgi:hypothetical protein
MVLLEQVLNGFPALDDRTILRGPPGLFIAPLAVICAFNSSWHWEAYNKYLFKLSQTKYQPEELKYNVVRIKKKFRKTHTICRRY